MAVEKKKVFISYSHKNKQVAEKIARQLIDSGIDAWFDGWEIRPGDSIVDKIFNEGLAKSKVFIILLSKDSVTSKWVKEEQNNAAIKHIEKDARIIPILVEDCEIPEPLRGIHRVSVVEDFEDAMERVIKAVYGVSDKPEIGEKPEYITGSTHQPLDMTREAWELGVAIAKDSASDSKAYSPKALVAMFPNLATNEIDDSVLELESHGLVTLYKSLGSAPFSFVSLEPTWRLFAQFQDVLDYSPEEDFRSVIILISKKNTVSNEEVHSLTSLPLERLNRAVKRIREEEYAKVYVHLGTAPYNFSLIQATHKTRAYARRLTEEN